MLSCASSRMKAKSSDIDNWLTMLQTYVKRENYAKEIGIFVRPSCQDRDRTLILLFEDRIFFEGDEFGRLCQLGILFPARLGDKKTGRRPKVIDHGDQAKENGKNRKDQHCATLGPFQENEGDDQQVDGYEEKSDRPMGKPPVKQ